MRQDATFIGIEVDDAVARDPAIAAKLAETCPVDVFAAGEGGHLEIVDRNVDECILCDMCLAVAPPGALAVHRLYDDVTVRS